MTATSTVAFARIINSKLPQLVKLVIAFNVYERDARNKLKFPVQKKCAYVSGDFDYSDLPRQLKLAEQAISSNNIKFAD